VKDAVVGTAIDYAAPKLQEEMKTLGIDPNTLGERIDARATNKLLEPRVTAALNAVQITKPNLPQTPKK
jgi:hypothetical protein